MKKYPTVVAATFLVLGLTGCKQPAANVEAKQQAVSSDAILNNQPLPVITFSQLRQNLIEIEIAQSTATQTTSFFFNQGVAAPLMSCPSIGFPIPNTASLSNPVQVIYSSSRGVATGGQMDPNGVYAPASSSGTYVICVDATGTPYANYWEGFVQTVTGPAKWNTAANQVELTGPPSFKFTKGK